MNRALLFRLSFMFSPFLAFAACGGPSESATSGPPSSTADAAPDTTDGGDADLGPPTGDGAIFLTGHSTGQVDVAAEFRTQTPAPGADGPIPPNGCVYLATPQAADDFVPNASAGSITATAGGAHVALQWKGGPKIAFGELQTGVDGPVTIEATGADVPAFSVTTRVPLPVALLTSAKPGIQKGADYDVAWTAGSNDTNVILTLAGRTASVECATTSDRGTIRIPGAMVDQVANDAETDGGAPHLVLTVTPSIVGSVRAGAYAVNVYATNDDAVLDLPLH